MIAEVMATVQKGALKLDGALPFPDQTRVKLRVEPVWDASAAQKTWLALLARIDEHPIVGVGGPYPREELYERD
jgi:hypothetical protein